MAPSLLRLALLLTLVAGLTFSITALPTRAQTPAPLDASAFELHEMGRIEGIVRTLQAYNNYLAVGANRTVTLYDLSDPGQPRILSSIALPDMVATMQFVDEYMYVSWGSCEIYIIISTGQCSGGIDLYDLALPTAPLFISRFADSQRIWEHFAVIDSIVYAPVGASQSNTLIDFRVPTAPVEITNSVHSLPRFDRLELVERPDRNGATLAYIGASGKLIIYDLQARRNLGVVELFDPPYGISSIHALTTPDNRHLAYVTDRNYGLHVIDVSDPSRPVRYSTRSGKDYDALVLGDNRLYISDNEQIYVYDLADPTAPNLIETRTGLGLGSIVGVGDYLVGSRAQEGIMIAKRFGLDAPRLVGVLPLLLSTAHPYVDGKLLVADERRGLTLIDIDRPAVPSIVPIETSPMLISRPRMAFDEDLGVFGRSFNEWEVVSLADPLAPRRMSTIPVPEPLVGGGLALERNQSRLLAYLLHTCQTVCTAEQVLQIVDLSDPSQPRTLSTLPIPHGGALWETNVHDGLVYLLREEPVPSEATVLMARMQIIDARTPAAPRIAGSIVFEGSPNGLALADDYAYVAAWWGGLHTIAVSDPDAPQLLSTFRKYPRQQTQAVAVDGPIIYVSTLYDAELFTLDMRDPTQPRLVDERIIPGGSAALTIVGDQLIASGAGMTMYRRGPMPPGAVVDLRGAPVTDVSVTMTAGARSSLAAATPSRATDVNGRFSVQGAATGTQLTPSFGEAAFWPAMRTLAQQPDALRFTMLAPPVTTAVSADTTTTLTFTDTQGLPTTFAAPAGSLSGASAVTLSGAAPTQTDGLELAGQAFEVRLVGADAQFGAPATVHVPYSRGDVRLISDRTQLALYRQTGSGWERAETGCTNAAAQEHDPTERTLTAAICAPGVYALLGPTERVYLPALAR